MHSWSSLKEFQENNFTYHIGERFQDKFSSYCGTYRNPTTQIQHAKYRKYVANLEIFPQESVQS